MRDVVTPVVRVVVADANILINLCYAGLLDLLERLPGFAFEVSDEVYGEVIEPEQRRQLDELLDRGIVKRASLAAVAELEIFAELRTTMGIGEASCIAAAQVRGHLLASDERKAFLREATKRLGEGRLLTTPGLFVLAIRGGLLTIEQADQAKKVLEAHRFTMRFASFADVLGR